jgi:hypothetical protein
VPDPKANKKHLSPSIFTAIVAIIIWIQQKLTSTRWSGLPRVPSTAKVNRIPKASNHYALGDPRIRRMQRTLTCLWGLCGVPSLQATALVSHSDLDTEVGVDFQQRELLGLLWKVKNGSWKGIPKGSPPSSHSGKALCLTYVHSDILPGQRRDQRLAGTTAQCLPTQHHFSRQWTWCIQLPALWGQQPQTGLVPEILVRPRVCSRGPGSPWANLLSTHQPILGWSTHPPWRGRSWSWQRQAPGATPGKKKGSPNVSSVQPTLYEKVSAPRVHSFSHISQVFAYIFLCFRKL